MNISILNKFAQKTLDFKLQVAILVSTIFLISLMFYFPIKKFNAMDPKPNMSPFYPKKGAESGEVPATEVTTGIFVKDFPLFDVTTGNFIMDGIIWFEFDPHAISIDTINKFSFDKGTIITRSEPKTKLVEDKIFAQYQIRIKFQANLDYRLFPLEDHRVYLILTNRAVSPSEAIFISYKTNISAAPNLKPGDWINKDNNVNYGYSTAQLDKFSPERTIQHPVVLFSFDFEKAGIKNILIIFAPLFVIFFLSFFSLMINIENTKAIIAFSSGSITTFIFNLFVIMRMSPIVSYFTISDKIYSLLLICVFSILLFNVSLLYYLKKLEGKKLAPEILNSIMEKLKLVRSNLLLFFSFLIVLVIYLVLY